MRRFEVPATSLASFAFYNPLCGDYMSVVLNFDRECLDRCTHQSGNA